jgi:hypothetical protein
VEEQEHLKLFLVILEPEGAPVASGQLPSVLGYVLLPVGCE